MSRFSYEVRYHRELAWWDARYRVYMVGASASGLLGGALTRRGARKLIKGVIAREKATQTYTVVETVTEPEVSAIPEEET